MTILTKSAAYITSLLLICTSVDSFHVPSLAYSSLSSSSSSSSSLSSSSSSPRFAASSARRTSLSTSTKLALSLSSSDPNNNSDQVAPSSSTDGTHIPQLIESELPTPHPDIPPEEVVPLVMNALQHNDDPSPNAGLEINFNFSSDRCRATRGGDLKSFIQYAQNPTFQSMIGCDKWTILSTGPLIEGTNTRGPMQTFLVQITPANKEDNAYFKVDGAVKKRTFLWTLQRERRPPRANCWLIHEVLHSVNAYSMTM